MLRLMRNRKAIIATDFGSVRGYVADGESGLLIEDIERDLAGAVARIERDPAAAVALGAAAYERYCRYFSLAAGGEALGRILAPAIAA
jgi:glycosyltransferase involved in cell wall biosynthesis